MNVLTMIILFIQITFYFKIDHLEFNIIKYVNINNKILFIKKTN